MTKKAIVGVDVGGTKIGTGVINQEGRVLGKPVVLKTNSSDPKEAIVERIIHSVEEALTNAGMTLHNIKGIGLGVTGPLDIENGIVLECPQLPTMHNFPLRKEVQSHFLAPVTMDNDANSLIFGEACFGAGTGHNTILGFTLGTGLGCAIIINKKVYFGASGTAGEIWLSPYKKGTIEDDVSGNGISRMYKKLTGKQKSALEIAELGRKGDGFALKTWMNFGADLAYAIAWGINFIDPDIVILGGSIANGFDLFGESMDASLRKNLCSVPAKNTKVVRAALGDNAGFIGAACLVLQGDQ